MVGAPCSARRGPIDAGGRAPDGGLRRGRRVLQEEGGGQPRAGARPRCAASPAARSSVAYELRDGRAREEPTGLSSSRARRSCSSGSRRSSAPPRSSTTTRSERDAQAAEHEPDDAAGPADAGRDGEGAGGAEERGRRGQRGRRDGDREDHAASWSCSRSRSTPRRSTPRTSSCSRTWCWPPPTRRSAPPRSWRAVSSGARAAWSPAAWAGSACPASRPLGRITPRAGELHCRVWGGSFSSSAAWSRSRSGGCCSRARRRTASCQRLLSFCCRPRSGRPRWG